MVSLNSCWLGMARLQQGLVGAVFPAQYGLGKPPIVDVLVGYLGEVMKQIIDALVSGILQKLRDDGTLPSQEVLPAFKVERPRDKTHGDFSTNAALVLARVARMKPRDLAEKMVAALSPDQKDVERWEIAGPGFINFFVTPYCLQQLLKEIAASGASYGHSNLGQGQQVLVEFVSANPTGPMHVGHGRGAVTGDVLARLLEATGHKVEREYYINDAGHQIDLLGHSVVYRFREKLQEVVCAPAEFYPGEYVAEIAAQLPPPVVESLRKALKLKDESGCDLQLPQELLDFSIQWVLADIRADLEKLGIVFDQWFSEKTLHKQGGIDRVVGMLTEKGLIYEGTLEKPKGGKPDAATEWAQRPQRLFKSTQFGDDVDRPLAKSDGSYTYFAADIAYHFNKVDRGFQQLIDVWGADHGGYVKRVVAALKALTGQEQLLQVVLVQMVNLTQGGAPVRMSKRAGNYVTLRDVVDRVGADAVRFWFLTRASGSQLDFDLDVATAKSNDNPVFYVQYAHARVHSVWRQLQEKGLGQADGNLALLMQTEELDLIRFLAVFPSVVEAAAIYREPHRIPYYLLDLAGMFHAYYHGYRILDPNPELRGARLFLIATVRQVLANGLSLLGVSAPEKM